MKKIYIDPKCEVISFESEYTMDIGVDGTTSFPDPVPDTGEGVNPYTTLYEKNGSVNP